jgi:hypothetical protein
MNTARAIRTPTPEPPVNPQQLLIEAARAFYLRAAVPPCPSELIDQLVHCTDPAERLILATLIRRSAP